MRKIIKYENEQITYKNPHLINVLKTGFLEFLREKGDVKNIESSTIEIALMAVDDLISRFKEYQAVPNLKFNLTSNRLHLINERIKQLESLKKQLKNEYDLLVDGEDAFVGRERVNLLKSINVVDNDLFKLKEKQFTLIANTHINYGSFDGNGVFKDRETIYPSLVSQIYEIFKKIGFANFTIEKIDQNFNNNEISLASLFGED